MDNLYNLSFGEIKDHLAAMGEPSYRADQIWQGMYQQGWTRIEEFTALPTVLRESLRSQFELGTLSLEKELASEDRTTRKFLFRLGDGSAIESVLMAYTDRQTACIASQVGCAMGCSFCATGNMGFGRNLSRAEIIQQVLLLDGLLAQEDKRLTNVVLMGMGEPFHNYENVLGSIHVLNHPRGFNMGQRRFTISTVGLVPGIRRFTSEKTQINLALSLHAADDQLRSTLLPINEKYSIENLMAACDEYLENTNRRITIEWALIAGVNDDENQANKLAHLLGGKLYHVNLIQLNPVEHYAGRPSQDASAIQFKKILRKAGIPCTIRLRRGIDIQAGCGQLASQSEG